MRRTDYVEVSGMCEELPQRYSGVGLGLKLKATSKKPMYVPSIQFVHYESMLRNPTLGRRKLHWFGGDEVSTLITTL